MEKSFIEFIQDLTEQEIALLTTWEIPKYVKELLKKVEKEENSIDLLQKPNYAEGFRKIVLEEKKSNIISHKLGLFS